MSFHAPPRATTADGSPRRVGFELEFSGVGLEQIAHRLAELLGGRVAPESTFRFEIVGTSLGTFTVEVDARALTERRYRDHLAKLGITLEREKREKLEKIGRAHV